MIFLLLPLAASVLYCFAALFLKTAINGGIGPWRSVFVTNWLMLPASLWLAFLPGATDLAAALPAAALTGLAFFTGQVLTFLAITRGDVSVATPVMGAKTVFVALLGVLFFGQEPGSRLWIAVVLAAAGIALLQLDPGARRGRALMTAGLASGSALAFAVTDLLMQQFAPACGARGYVPLVFAVNALLSLGLVPLFRQPLRGIPPALLRPLLAGAGLIALQSSLIAAALSVFGHAAEVNIVYSLRGLWSVLLVWMLAGRLGGSEHRAGRAVFLFRLAGALCAVVSVVLILSP